MALPSEDSILDFIRTSTSKVGKREIARAFGVKGAERIALKRLLKDMAGRGLLDKGRRRFSDPTKLPPVTVLIVQGTDDDGELFATPENWDESEHGEPPRVLLQTRRGRGMDTSHMMPGTGDRVLARLSPGEDDSYPHVGRIIRKIAPASARLLGVFRMTETGEGRITPVDKRGRSELMVHKGDTKGAEPHELVAFDVIRDRGRGLVRARITERLGVRADPGNISLIALHQHGIAVEFPPPVLEAAKELRQVGLKGRKDCRNMPLVTIDPPDARDHDDAVWAAADPSESNRGGFNLCVAIADVAAYVSEDGVIDREAKKRGNSVYLPDRVVPMLPERLSTDLCSLVEGKDRPAVACFMTIDRHGNLKASRFDRIMMRSAASLSYEVAQAAVDGRGGVDQDLLETVLRPLWQAYAALEKARQTREPLDLDLPERKLILSRNGELDKVIYPARLGAHRLIEEFMVLANVAAARTLQSRKQPLIYRVHEAPSAAKIEMLADVLSPLGIKVGRSGVMKPAQFNRILDKVRGTPHEPLVSQLVLRSQSQAVYSPQNLGHFGLNLGHYAHFTSPIRRYADLTVHRALVAARNDPPPDLADLERTADHISTTERVALAAERDTCDRLIAAHLSQRVGSRFSGRISGANRAGLFISLDDTGADGFVPVSSIGTEYFEHDEARAALVGRTSGDTFMIGDAVQVRLLEATPVAGGLRFEILSDPRPGKPPKRRRRKPPARKRRR